MIRILRARNLQELSVNICKSRSAEEAVPREMTPDETGDRPRSRTARMWLKMLGYKIVTVRKAVYIDGNERANVVEYRGEFKYRMREIEERLDIWDEEDGSWKRPPGT